MKFFSRIFLLAAIILCGVVATTGCDSGKMTSGQPDYGYVQFRLLKESSLSKASLDYLSDAAKIKVTLRSLETRDILSPNVIVTPVDKETSAYGVLTEKVKLLSGEYSILGYQIFDCTDTPIQSYSLSDPTTFTVVPGGLEVEDLGVDVTPRGYVKFRLKADCSEIPTTKGSGADEYAFHFITYADVYIKNIKNNSSLRVEHLKMTHEFIEEEGITKSVCVTDSLVSLPAGAYKITGFKTYFDNRFRVWEETPSYDGGSFSVYDNKTTDPADVPLALKATAEYIQDAIALRDVWLGLDGPNWEKYGATIIWNFDADVNVWLAQPGVELLQTGRIAQISFTGTGAHGPMPAAIGRLTDLRQLYFGSHSFDPGADPIAPAPCDHSDRVYACRITELPPEINNLKNLEYLYIGYSGITTLPDDMSGMEHLTDVEIFSAFDMTEFPKGLATLPSLQSLTFSANYDVRPESTMEGLAAINAGAAGESLQILYLPSQPIEHFPDFSRVVNLQLLHVQNCGILDFETAFGKSHPFTTFNASYNKLSSLPRDAEGFFVGLSSDTESLDFSYNNFTEVPDMFSALSVHTLGSVSFAYNKITGFEHGSSWRGIRVGTFSLAGNLLPEFPLEIYPSGSTVNYLQLQQNRITKVSPEALEGDYTHMTSAIDLSYNMLERLPDKFNSRTFQYLTGLDLSYNRFDHFPYAAVNNTGLLSFVFQHQRDAEGNRCMREWPTGIGNVLPGLRALYLGSNDIRKVEDSLSPLIYILDISDNPNISIDVSGVCPYIKNGSYYLIYSPGQDIRGCDALLLEE